MSDQNMAAAESDGRALERPGTGTAEERFQEAMRVIAQANSLAAKLDAYGAYKLLSEHLRWFDIVEGGKFVPKVHNPPRIGETYVLGEDVTDGSLLIARAGQEVRVVSMSSPSVAQVLRLPDKNVEFLVAVVRLREKEPTP